MIGANRIARAAATAALCAGVLGGCGGQAETEAPRPRLVRAVTASYDSLVIGVTAWGRAEANRRVELAFEVSGTVERLPYDEGETAPAGATLGSLRQGRFKANLVSAEASFKDAERSLARMRVLHKEEVVSDEELEQDEIELAEAEARLRSAEEDLRGSVITAPFGGVVTKRHCEIGQVVAPGTPAFVLMEMDPIVIRIELSDSDVSRVAEGQPAAVRFDAHPDETFNGVVSRVAAAANELGGAFEVEIEIANPRMKIKPGMAAEVEIAVERLRRGIVLPVEAIVYDSGIPYAYVVSGGRAEKTRIEVEGQSEMTVAVRGLSYGDTVVSAGNRFLKDGEMVRVSVDGAKR